MCFLDTSSIDAICSSNHTLQLFGQLYCDRSTSLPDQIVSYLKLNENKNKVEVLRQKLIRSYFAGGAQNMDVFVNMCIKEDTDLKPLPHIMGWMCRNAHGFSIMYQFAKRMASVFEIDSANVGCSELSGKRKRGTYLILI